MKSDMKSQAKSWLICVCSVQMVVVLWRQIFDYLGFMWGPILVNFFQIIFIIFGCFGAWQNRSKYVICYCSWSVFWSGWNAFVICFYENVGVLNREMDLLSLGTGSISWWESNGPGCKLFFSQNQTLVETNPWKPPRPGVKDCYVPYHHLEAAQASFNILLAIVGFFLGISFCRFIKKSEDYGSSQYPNKATKARALYAVEYARDHASMSESLDEGELVRGVVGGGSRPMTPRRVKRRSIHSRGNLPPPYHHRESSMRRSGRHSTRSSGRRRTHHNPVTKLMEHQQAALHHEATGHTNLMYQHSSIHSLDEERPGSARSSYSNYHGTRSHSYRHSHNFLATGPPAYSSQSETAI